MMLSLVNFREKSNKVKQQSRCFFMLVSAFLLPLSGCQLLNNSSKENVEFNHYYLWIKSLNDQEIVDEISRQKNNKQSGLAPADIQLIMLYSLPNSPIHNPYTAKSQLNDYPLEPYKDTIFNTTDLAFVVMLKDQLNQQLLILEELNNYKGAYKQSKALLAAQEIENAMQKNKIAEAQKTINRLNKTIVQLKKIEKAISEHGK